jgi:simple sugar transport system permease protein
MASILRGLTGDVSYVTVVAISFVPLAYFILWRTAFKVASQDGVAH